MEAAVGITVFIIFGLAYSFWAGTMHEEFARGFRLWALSLMAIMAAGAIGLAVASIHDIESRWEAHAECVDGESTTRDGLVIADCDTYYNAPVKD